jgi:hypothetical protein
MFLSIKWQAVTLFQRHKDFTCKPPATSGNAESVAREKPSGVSSSNFS